MVLMMMMMTLMALMMMLIIMMTMILLQINHRLKLAALGARTPVASSTFEHSSLNIRICNNTNWRSSYKCSRMFTYRYIPVTGTCQYYHVMMYESMDIIICDLINMTIERKRIFLTSFLKSETIETISTYMPQLCETIPMYTTSLYQC